MTISSFFTDTGKVYRKKGYQIPESGKTAKGINMVNVIQVENGEKVQAMLHFRETEDKPLYLFMTTRSGTVKRLPVDQLKNIRQSGIRAPDPGRGRPAHQRTGDGRGSSLSSSPPTTARRCASTRAMCGPWAVRLWACAASG